MNIEMCFLKRLEQAAENPRAASARFFHRVRGDCGTRLRKWPARTSVKYTRSICDRRRPTQPPQPVPALSRNNSPALAGAATWACSSRLCAFISLEPASPAGIYSAYAVNVVEPVYSYHCPGLILSVSNVCPLAPTEIRPPDEGPSLNVTAGSQYTMMDWPVLF
jgi:hypothetical protein